MTAGPATGPVGFEAARALVCLLFFTFAMTSDAVGSVVSRVIGELHLSMTAAGAFQYVPMAAMAAGAVSLGYLADRLGRRPAVIAGLALYGGSSLLFAFGNSFGFFVGLLALSGLGISLFKTGALALIGDLSTSPGSHTRLMNAAEGFFGIGSIVGPAVVALLLAAGLSWKWLYVIAAGICIGLMLLAARMRFPQAPAPASTALGAPRAVESGSTLRVLKDPYALGFAALIMLYAAVECAVYVWMPTYLRSYRGATRWLPLYGLTIFFVLRALGRFLGIWLLRHLRWNAVLAACSVFILMCFAGAVVGGRRVRCLAAAGIRPGDVGGLSHPQLQGHQLLSEVGAWCRRRRTAVLYGGRGGARSARHGRRQRCLRGRTLRIHARDRAGTADEHRFAAQLAARSRSDVGSIRRPRPEGPPCATAGGLRTGDVTPARRFCAAVRRRLRRRTRLGRPLSSIGGSGARCWCRAAFPWRSGLPGAAS